MYDIFFLVIVYLVLFGAVFFLISGLRPADRKELIVTGSLATDRERLKKSSPGYHAFLLIARYLTDFLPDNRFVGYFSRIEKQLTAAGSPGAITPREFFALKEIGLITGAVGGVICLGSAHWFWALVLTGFGFFYPDIWLRDRIRKRQRSMLREIPFSLDLLTLSVESGLDIASGLERMVAKSGPGPLREEFFLTLQEMKMGRSRMDSLKRFADRVDVPDITSLIQSLVQAEEMGAGLAPALRVQSEQLRNKRFQRAEKLAMEAPVKMTFPLLFIFISVFLMLFGSVLLSAFRGGLF